MNKSDYNDASSAKRMCSAGIEDLTNILDALPEEGSLPSWWTNKLAVSTAYLNSLRDYLLYSSKDEDIEDDDDEEEEDDTEELSSIKVGSYTTKHFDICPQAARLYASLSKTITEDKQQVATQSAMLHDMLFYLEKQIIEEEYASDSEVKVAEDLVNNILLLADSMGNRPEHSYLKDVHLAKIKEYNKANVPDEEMLPPSYKQVGI
jgi:hypothetical protein